MYRHNHHRCKLSDNIAHLELTYDHICLAKPQCRPCMCNPVSLLPLLRYKNTLRTQRGTVPPPKFPNLDAHFPYSSPSTCTPTTTSRHNGPQTRTPHLHLDSAPLELVGQTRIIGIYAEYIPRLRLGQCVEQCIECSAELACDTRCSRSTPTCTAGTAVAVLSCIFVVPIFVGDCGCGGVVPHGHPSHGALAPSRGRAL